MRRTEARQCRNEALGNFARSVPGSLDRPHPHATVYIVLEENRAQRHSRSSTWASGRSTRLSFGLGCLPGQCDSSERCAYAGAYYSLPVGRGCLGCLGPGKPRQRGSLVAGNAAIGSHWSRSLCVTRLGLEAGNLACTQGGVPSPPQIAKRRVDSPCWRIPTPGQWRHPLVLSPCVSNPHFLAALRPPASHWQAK